MEEVCRDWVEALKRATSKSEIQPVRRLELAWASHQWTVIRERRVKMRLPAANPRPRTRQGTELIGTWYEVLGRDGAMLYRRRTFLPDRIEAFATKSQPHSIPLPRSQWGVLEVVVPDLPEAHALYLFSSDTVPRVATPPAPGRSASPVAVVDLTRDYTRRRSDKK